ncbi:helix-turn-helix domain-containing protein [Rhodovarius crocodyli]|nr:helix-turn-helix domain-containing protein [Rhodovarius crocodyli]
MANRIKALRKAAGMTQQDLADHIGVDKTTIWRYETGSQEFFQKPVTDMARILGAPSPEQLLSSFPEPVRLYGNVGAGAEVIPLDEETIWLDGPPGLNDPIAAEVVGRSMLPVYRPRDILFFDRRTRVDEDVIGEDCMVKVSDGRILVKRVLRGFLKGHYRLFSYDTQEESEDLRLEWASPVEWVKRARTRG